MIGVYVRVSSRQQDTASQKEDLRRWVAAQGEQVRWYSEKASGRTMDRPAWRRLGIDYRRGMVDRIVVWRLDRLGRTASGLTTLFDELRERGVGLVSLRDGLDLGTPAGRLMGNVLASVAQFENEVRAERVLAGQEAARKAGKRWGGSKKGRRITVTDEQVNMARQLREAGQPIASIARTLGISRPTVYRLLNEEKVAS